MSIYLVSVSSPQVSVLVVEDDPGIATQLVRGLERAGYSADSVAMGAEALRRPPSDVVLLDLGLPDVDGMDVCRRLRADSDAAIIVVTARGEEADRVLALDEGADDYLTKPFGIGELLARLRVAQRHLAERDGAELQTRIEAGDLTIDLAAHRVQRNGSDVHLTPIEYKLLTALAQHRGKVLTHRHLLREVWGAAHVESPHYLRIYMRTLRHKIEADPARPRFLLTEVGVGYRFADDATA
jgi:two-component system KDP operon response regulator KdpE